jgi:uncharacterized protein (TIGR03435 family)
MLLRAFATVVFLTLAARSGLTQTAGPAAPAPDPLSLASASLAPPPVAAFAAIDVHPSPPRTFPYMDGGNLRGQLYDIRQATMVDLIAKAYGVEVENVQGGPSWLEWDRFDVVAKAPAGTPPATVKLMLQALLKERFGLVVHEGSAPMPAYVLRAGKDKPKMKESDGTGDDGCEGQPPPPDQPPGTIPQNVVKCSNMTMDKFAEQLHWMAGGYLDKPVVNLTELEGTYDFELKWTGRGNLAKAGADGISIFDAVDKQLGLKLALETAPRPVMIVDTVNKTPTPNVANVEKLLPPAPPMEFEVATIKPSKPGTREMGNLHGDQLNVQSITLHDLLTFAWDLNPVDKEALVNAPKWLDTDRYDILAKIAIEDQGEGPSKSPQIEDSELEAMLQVLLEDRFQMKVHRESRSVTSYTLMAVSPKLTKADPKARTKCSEGPGPDGKDPRIANPVLGRLLTCQNMSMAQLADHLRYEANGYIHYPVQDATGLEGGWNFTLSFSTIGQLLPGNGGGSPPPDGGTGNAAASDPNGAVSLFDALKRELGLKLEKQQRQEQVLVIDHIEEQPTAN